MPSAPLSDLFPSYGISCDLYEYHFGFRSLYDTPASLPLSSSLTVLHFIADFAFD